MPFFRVFAVTLVLLFSFNSHALSAHTTNVIHGNAPYLTFDGGRTRATDANSLLGITLSDGRQITPNTNNSWAMPIELPRFGESFADIGMLVPTNTNTIALSTLIGAPYNYWRDDDGDGQENNGISATGNLTLTILDNNNQVVARNHVLTVCKAPYKVILASTNGILSTLYGAPNRSDFNASNATYFINPKASPTVCFARPNLRYGGANDVVNGDIVDFRGPEWMWDSNKGFLTQSTTPSSYHLNFPTTGANNLYFDLEIGGYNGALTWAPVTRSGITATMRYTYNNVVRVTLTGPAVSDSQAASNSPGRIAKPSLPQTFELIGRDGSGNEVVKYGFVLQQWFVHRLHLSLSNEANSWCSNIGYRLTKVKDLTNASCQGTLSGPHCVGAVGATPPSPNNRYQRIIRAGFFSEWGFMDHYAKARFSNTFYWASDRVSNKSHARSSYVVFSDDADISSRQGSFTALSVCVTP